MSKELKKLRFSKRDPTKNYEVMGEDYVKECAHPIVKIKPHHDDNWCVTLDTMGDAAVMPVNDKRVDKT